MKYIFLSFLLLTFCQVYSQPVLPDNYILPLPEELDTSEVSIDEINKAINRLHNFSEFIYNPVKILNIDSISFSPGNLTDTENNNRWGEGIWGRGPFSKYVDRFLFDEINKTAYSSFYGSLLNEKLKSNYWSTHPVVSYCSRTTMAYYYLFAGSNNEIVKSFCKDRFINGAKYLITQQQSNGGYVQWHWRKDKLTPNLDDDVGLNNINSYATATAIYALKRVYDYLIQSVDKSSLLIDTIYNTIEKAGNFLVIKNNRSAHKNYISFSIWGLVNAYKVTNNFKFIESALAKYINDIESFQDTNGAWYKKSGETIDYHDAHSPYMGIILRALIDVYDILPSHPFSHIKERLRKSIIKGFNHFLFLDIVHKYFPQNDVRLANDGGIYPYSKQKEYTKFKGRALQLSQAIMYALLSNGLFTDEEDRNRLKKFLSAVMNFQVSETTNNNILLHINSDIYYQTFSMYLRLKLSKAFE